MNKDLIHSRFAKHLEDYNKHAVIQKKMAEKLVSFCSKKKYGKILEIGCGTGFLTKIANVQLEFESYTAIDIVEECKAYIFDINPNINFAAADMENFSLDKYDLIISNAALQWSEDFKGIINKLEKSLNISGEIIFSTFGKENFREIFYISGTGLNYYSETELKEIFPNSEVYPPEIYIMSFKTPKEVLKHLQKTGVNAVEARKWTKKDLIDFENYYSNLCGNFPTITYNPIYVKIKNPTVG